MPGLGPFPRSWAGSKGASRRGPLLTPPPALPAAAHSTISQQVAVLWGLLLMCFKWLSEWEMLSRRARQTKGRKCIRFYRSVWHTSDSAL